MPTPVIDRRNKAKYKIFISYRRGDTAGRARLLFDRLQQRFGGKRVFLDTGGAIPAGTEYAERIWSALGSCKAFLAVIGPGWLDSRGEAGNRRLDDPDDWVRAEIREALGSKVKVFPVRVGGAAPPASARLPDDISGLVGRQDFEIRDRHVDEDTENLIRDLPVRSSVAYLLSTMTVRVWLALSSVALVVSLVLLNTCGGREKEVVQLGTDPVPAPIAVVDLVDEAVRRAR